MTRCAHGSPRCAAASSARAADSASTCMRPPRIGSSAALWRMPPSSVSPSIRASASSSTARARATVSRRCTT
ncbi:MAG: hypothetical protein ACK55I_25235, partial [bacterium]